MSHAFPYISLILFSVLFGISMKIADLLDEHSLDLFPRADIVFGILTGVFGSLMIMDNDIIANVIFAIYLGFLLRNKLDFLNHRIGAAICFIVYATYATFLPGVFYICFLVINLGIDNLYDYLKSKKYQHYYLTELGLPIISLAYSLYTHDISYFSAFLAYTLGYNGTKFFATKCAFYED